MQTIYQKAKEQIGVSEIAGSVHSPAVLSFFSDSGNDWVKDDETPWCAAFVGAMLSRCGLKHTGKLNARSYLEYGTEVGIYDAVQGDIVVLWRKDRNGPYGHVAFFSRLDGDHVWLLGGNQSDQVGIAKYPLDRVLSVRRVPAMRPDLTKSRTIKAVDTQRKGLATAAGSVIASGAAVVVQVLGDPSNAVEAVQAGNAIGDLLPFVGGIAAIVALVAVVIVRLNAEKIEDARVDDHKRGLR